MNLLIKINKKKNRKQKTVNQETHGIPLHINLGLDIAGLLKPISVNVCNYYGSMYETYYFSLSYACASLFISHDMTQFRCTSHDGHPLLIDNYMSGMH